MEDKSTLLVSAEECAEIDECTWIREATGEEIAKVEELNPGMSFDRLLVDGTGRPYFWRTVLLKQCPVKVAEKAALNVRVFRFT